MIMDPVPIDLQNYYHDEYDKDTMNSSSYSVWNNFFLLAGIPNTVANEYAVTFSQHRIRIDMLKEITKEILLDMGIKAMGDIIAILRHAKNLYTQDELKGGTKTAPSGSLANNIIPPRQTIVNHLAQRAPITTTRPGPSISSLVGNKIQSRVSLNSGALIASSNNSTTISNDVSNKRSSSTISTSLAKRLRPANSTTIGGHETSSKKNLPEKTLTVKYPSGPAIAKAQQRILTNSSAPARGPASTSIKSRLGTSLSESAGRIRSATSNQLSNNGRKSWSQAPNGGNGVRNLSTSSTFASGGKRIPESGRSNFNNKREQARYQPSRMKSTVFNRLGDGAR